MLCALGMALCCIAPFGLVAVWWWLWHESAWLLAAGISVPLCAGLFVVCRKRYGILRSGLRGEAHTARVLRSLGQECCVLVNPSFVVGQSRCEVDAAVTMPGAVVLVEAKNHVGTIAGGANAAVWRQVKRSGETKEMKNPLLQNERQVRLVQALLQQAGLRCPVYGLVYFSSGKVHVSVGDSRICVGDEALLAALRRTKRGRTPAARTLLKVLRAARA